MNLNFLKDSYLINLFKNSGIVVMPTDTVYGILGSAMDKNTVECIYDLRKRNKKKPCIILVGDISELKKFSILLTKAQEIFLKKVWPGPVSVIFDCPYKRFEYLHRGTNTLAFRLPKNKEFRDFLKKTGPLIAPSANIEGKSVAKDITEAKKYFKDLVDLYVDAKVSNPNPSKVIRLYRDGTYTIIRK